MDVAQTPTTFLSGIFFPMNDAPAWIQLVVRALPPAYLAKGCAPSFIDDASLWTVRWDLVILLAVSGVFVVMAWRCCSWE